MLFFFAHGANEESVTCTRFACTRSCS